MQKSELKVLLANYNLVSEKKKKTQRKMENIIWLEGME